MEMMSLDSDCNSSNNYFQYDVIGALKTGEQFKSYPSNAAGYFPDNNNSPWLFVGENYSGGVSGCFVRANRDFVKPINAPNVKQGTALPMTIIFAEEMGSLTVPDRNTTASAYGGELRLYDVHIAKMFEVTKFLCDRFRSQSDIIWNYRAGGGSIRMGTFNITCAEANSIASIFGRGKPEITPILYIGEEGYRREETFDIPILNIVGDKIPQWLDFVETFSPVR
jgi:serine/threonine-protein kinase